MTQQFQVPTNIAEEWVQSSESIGIEPDDYDDPSEFQDRLDDEQAAIRCLNNGNVNEIDAIRLWQWLQNCEGMDWFENDKEFIQFTKKLGVWLKVYRVFTEEDARAKIWSSATGRSRKNKPDFRLNGIDYTFDMHPQHRTVP